MNILKACSKYLGTKYVWGGESQSEGGFDCSGYVYNVLREAGLSIRRTTAQGYYNMFAGHVADAYTDGALLFFGKDVNHITHVAINVGDGIHMYESIGGKANTKKNPGQGVTRSKIARRKDLVAIRTPYYNPLAKTPLPVLKEGLKGDMVIQLQIRLNEKFSAGLKIDGSYGPKTKKCVKAFQSACGLTADGIYGPLSAEALNKLLWG